MPGKMARSAPSTTVRAARRASTVRTSRLSRRKAGNTRIFTPDRESSGESRFRHFILKHGNDIRRSELSF